MEKRHILVVIKYFGCWQLLKLLQVIQNVLQVFAESKLDAIDFVARKHDCIALDLQ